MIALLRPTRGLVFTASEQSLWEELHEVPHVRFWTSDLPIPDSFEHLAEQFLASPASHAWFVEEDIVAPRGALGMLLELDADIAALNYRLKADGRLSELRRNGELIWVSLGCTLVRRRVFEQLARPWFRTDYVVASIKEGRTPPHLELRPGPSDYGGQDAYFCWQARAAGFTLAAAPEPLCEHLIWEAPGQARTNDGCHRISSVSLPGN